jgi:hypothetical protein
MADITKSSDAGLTRGEFNHSQSRQAGAEIAAGDALRLDSNGLLQKASTATQFASGTFGTQYAFAGLAPRAIPSGTVGEVYGAGTEWFYADSGLTIPGAVYLSATAGKLANSPVNANDNPVGQVLTATNIKLDKGV